MRGICALMTIIGALVFFIIGVMRLSKELLWGAKRGV